MGNSALAVFFVFSPLSLSLDGVLSQPDFKVLTRTYQENIL